MKQQEINKLLTVGIIILFVANLFMSLNYIEDSLNFGESGVIVGVMIYSVSFILIIIISVVLLLLVYKKIIEKKILVILSIILIILLCGFAANIIINTPLGGTKLYDYDSDSFKPIGQTRIFGNYVTWSGDNEVYLLNINDKTSTKIDYVTNGPVIYEDYVFFENNNTIYQYTISTGDTKEIVNGEGTSLDASENNIIWFENQSIYVFNIEDKEAKVIESDNITLPIVISDNYVAWREFVRPHSDEYWELWFGEDAGYDDRWTESGVFDIWIYDIANDEKTKVLSNRMQIIYFGEPVIDLYEDTIAYANNLSIYTYDISTGGNKEIVKHSKINEIQNSDSWKTGYIRDVLIYGNNIVFGEHYSEQLKYDGTNYRYYDISSGNNFEIDISADDMYQNYVVGWARTISGTKSRDYELYLVDLKNK